MIGGVRQDAEASTAVYLEVQGVRGQSRRQKVREQLSIAATESQTQAPHTTCRAELDKGCTVCNLTSINGYRPRRDQRPHLAACRSATRALHRLLSRPAAWGRQPR